MITVQVYDKSFRLCGVEGVAVSVWRSGPAPPLDHQVLLSQISVSAVLGVYVDDADDQIHYLVLCAEAERVDAVCGGASVSKIIRAQLFPFEDKSNPQRIGWIEKLLSSGTFFFSEPGDTKGGVLLQKRNPNQPLKPMIKSPFLWNRKLIENVIHVAETPSLIPQVISPLIHGFVGTRKIDSLGITLTLSSRRSNKQAGTRYNARGIDDEGSVAIFTETELIVEQQETGKIIFSHLQIRGSVPVFWSQSPSTTAIEITRNHAMTRKAFAQHIRKLSKAYLKEDGKIVFVNLLSESKSGETVLTTEMQNHIGESEGPIVTTSFDFHKFVNSSKNLEESLAPLVDRLRPLIKECGFSDSQKGVMRTNCLDCLDRTNVVQMSIAWEAFMMALGEGKSDTPAIDYNATVKPMFIDLWIDNGDAISKGYSGTGSVLSRMVKSSSGKKNSNEKWASLLEHSWRSANRYLVGTWEDEDRQQAISALLGGHHSLTSPETSAREKSNHIHPVITIWSGTWNLNGNRVRALPWPSASADIYVFNFQEVVELNPGSVLFSGRGDDERNRDIDACLVEWFGKAEDKNLNVIQVGYESMVGLYMTVFVRDSLVREIDRIKLSRCKAGYGGTTGNKGSVMMSFRLWKSLECEFVNVHLDSGELRNEERMQQLKYVLSHTKTFKMKHVLPRISVVSGDFNFRCDGVDPLLAIELIDRGRVEKLRKFDPFLGNQRNVLKTNGFHEMPLVFAPTYKYDGAFLSDKRTPSWCDRVFFKGMHISAKEYHAVEECILSDHKPVYAVITVNGSGDTADESASIPVSPTVEQVSRSSTPLQTNTPTRPPPPLVDLLSGDGDHHRVSRPDDNTFPDLLLFMSRWSRLTQFSGDPYLQSMMGHGLRAASQAEMVEKLAARGFLVCPPHVQKAFAHVDRKLFCASNTIEPYSNIPQKLSKHHAISTPQLHAQILSLLASVLGPKRVAAEIGAGSGYLPAVMHATGCDMVVACEADPSLTELCKANLPSSVVVTSNLPSESLVYDAVYVSPYFRSRNDMLRFLAQYHFSPDARAVVSFKDADLSGQQLCLLERHIEIGWHARELFRVMGEPMQGLGKCR